MDTADCVCMECGLVLDRIIGREGQSGEREGGAKLALPMHLYPDKKKVKMVIVPLTEEEKRREEERRARREMRMVPSCQEQQRRKAKIRAKLQHFQADNEYMVERVLHRFNRIYGHRKQRPGFRKDRNKEAVALAFAIHNTFCMEKAPRPPQFITKICGFESDGDLLQVPAILNMSEEEMKSMRREDYECSYAQPQDYIHTLCQFLGLNMYTANITHYLIKDWEWLVFGKYPRVIAASVLSIVLDHRSLQEEPGKASVTDEMICEALHCTLDSVKRLKRELRKKHFPNGFYIPSQIV